MNLNLLEVKPSYTVGTYRLFRRTRRVVLDIRQVVKEAMGFRGWLINGIIKKRFFRGGGSDLLIFNLTAVVEKDVLGVGSEPRRVKGKVILLYWDGFYTTRVIEEVILGVDL